MKNSVMILARTFGMLLCILVAGAAIAQPNLGEDITKKIAFTQRLGAVLPLDAELQDDTGKTIKFGDVFGKRPVLLMPVFYTCKSSCLLVRDGVIRTLNAQKKLVVGEDFDVVAISIHPNETSELANAKKKEWVADYKRKESVNGFHLLVGKPDQVKRITDAIGFKYYYDPKTDTVAHPAGIVLCTTDGRASEYLLGINYAPKHVYDGILQAQKNVIGQETEQVLFGCLMYNPTTGKYFVVVDTTLKVVGTTFALFVIGAVVYMSRKYRQPALTKKDLQNGELKPLG